MGQIRLLLWKHFIQKRRAWKLTLSEIILPVLLVLLVVWLRSLSPDETITAASYTCPRESGISNTLLFPKGENGSGFIFEMDTSGIGNPGIITIPPLAYIFAMASKLKFAIALAPEIQGDTVSEEFISAIYQKWSEFTKTFDESPKWKTINTFLSKYFHFKLCGSDKLVKRFNSSHEMDTYIKGKDYGKSPWIGDCPGGHALDFPHIHMALVIAKAGRNDGTWSYKIRSNSTVIPMTYPEIGYFDKLANGVQRGYQDKYAMSGFLTMQQFVDRMIINKTIPVDTSYISNLATRQICDSLSPLIKEFLNHSLIEDFAGQYLDRGFHLGNTTINCTKLMGLLVTNPTDWYPFTGPTAMIPNDLRVAPFPTAEYQDRSFYRQIQDVFALDLLLTYLWPISRLIRCVVHEKESKFRESMKIMGMRTISLHLSWFLTYALMFTTIALLITLITFRTLFARSNPMLIFAFFALFGISVVAYCFLVSIFFNKAKAASTAGVVWFFMGFFVYFGIHSQNATVLAAHLACLLSPAAFGIGASILTAYEGAGQGVTWGNILDPANPQKISFIYVLGAFLFDTIFYLSAAYVLEDRVEHGEIQNLFNPSDPNTAQNISDPLLQGSNPFIEKPSESEQQLAQENRCIHLDGIRKVFDDQAPVKVAINHLNLTMYENQIFVLLGPNGAGKSTLISVLTCLLSATSGTGKILGMDLQTDLDRIRSHLGLCPQHDILLPELTVEEHLIFFANLKKVENVEEEIERYIDQIQMQEFRHRLAGHLSGGQKRKLSVAIALLGGSKVVFLDEPTSGMDVYSRRSIWNMLLEHRRQRIIVLTTHFMDEADLLGDRIGIMANGQLRCCGSSLFLKKKYDVGYSIQMSLPEDTNANNFQTRIQDIGKDMIPSSKLSVSGGSEISISVPFAQSSALPNWFRKLDTMVEQKHINAYGVSVTTLEAVFIKVTSDAMEDASGSQESFLRLDSGLQSLRANSDNDDTFGRVSAYHRFQTHFEAMMMKRWNYSKRDKKSMCCSVLMPVLLLLVGFIVLKLFPVREQPELVMNATQFPLNRNSLPINISSPIANEDVLQFRSSIPPAFRVLDAQIPFGISNVCEMDSDENDIPDGANIAGMSEWIRQRHSYGILPFFGAVQVNTLDREDRGFSAVILHNSTTRHGPPLFANTIDEAVFQFYHGFNNNQSHSIQVTSHPLPFTLNAMKIFDSFAAMSAAIIVLIAFSFIPASVVVFVVKEREMNIKHQQTVSGASLMAHWLSSYAWDMLVFLIPWLCSIILIYVFKISSFRGVNLSAIAVLFVFYGHGIIPFTYLVSYMFESHSTAQNMILFLNFITGLVLMIVSFVMQAIESTQAINRTLIYVYRLFPGFCLGNGLLSLTIRHTIDEFIPIEEEGESPFSWDILGADICYLAVQGTMSLMLTILVDHMIAYPHYRKSMQRISDGILNAMRRCSGSRSDSSSMYDVEDSNGRPLLEMVLDEDVLREAEAVDHNPQNGDMLVLQHLQKRFGSKRAVNDLTFGVGKGICFGFLGVNGAGKTTTMKILTGDLLPTAGTAWINNRNIATTRTTASEVGYCPQFDALWEFLTVREHLEYYGKIKNVSTLALPNKINELIERLNLSAFENQLACRLSGGNRRKLSLGTALIGSPKLVFLDEPSTGVDVTSRQCMWKVIHDLCESGVTVVLTSHSMEECEALCNRVGIMVHGKLRCLGTLPHLKSKFGQGFTVDIKYSNLQPEAIESFLVKYDLKSRAISAEEMEEVCLRLGNNARFRRISQNDSTGWIIASLLEQAHSVETEMFASWWLYEDIHDKFEGFCRNHFESPSCVERQTNKSTWTILKGNLSIADIFELFEQERGTLHVEEYSIGQTTLEQIFIAFASESQEDS